MHKLYKNNTMYELFILLKVAYKMIYIYEDVLELAFCYDNGDEG